MTNTIKIALLWHTLDHPNLGVDALTRANIAILRAAAERASLKPEFVLLGTPSAAALEPDMVQGPRFSPKRIVLMRSDYLKTLRSCDIAFDISEGDSFTDIYGISRFLQQSATKVSAILQSIPLVLSPQTIGPFNSGWTRKVAGWIIGKTARTYARDDLSSRALSELGAAGNTDEAIDVAFRLPFQRPERSTAQPLKIGINVSGLLFNGGYTGSNEFGMRLDYPAFVRQIISHFYSMEGVEIWLVPHVIAPNTVDDDTAASRILLAEFPNVRLAPIFSNSIEAKSFISGLDFFSGARMHACIAAYSSGVPVVPVAYSRKFNGLFGTLGYVRLVDGLSDDNTSAFGAIISTFDERIAAAAEINTGLGMIHERLERYESAAATLFSNIKTHV
ncbi:MAG: polysaccharide pyruvyl transferase family protein [bacterium]|nr:polysaccharide pyruvyl transferase family protein [bacterium]